MTSLQRLAALVAALSLVAAAPAHKRVTVPRAAPDAVTHGVASVGGVSIPYTARAGTIALKNDKEEITARMFYVAYTKTGTGSSRPLTFFYNGGPGSSTVWLHMGSFAPMRVVTANGTGTGPAPFHLVNNAYSLLDKTDMVFVDAPNTGFSRVIGYGNPKDFMGVDQDARAFSQFIQRYLTQFDRWNSPKVLFGESYGTTRDCVLVNDLQHAGVQMNGVVLQSSILNFGLGGLGGGQPIGGGDWSYVTYLPTEAATAWYFHRAGNGQTLSTFLHGVEAFARGRYLRDLAQGADLNASEYASVVQKLHGYLGLSTQFLRDSNLRVSYPRFEKELMRDGGLIVGRYDGRFTTYDIDGEAQTPSWDPSDVGISGAFVGTFNAYVRDTLHYSTNLQYRPTAYGGQLGARWDMHHAGNDPPANVAPDLAEAMATNAHLKVFSANGRYDFATPYFATVYTLEHLNLAPALQKNISYGFYDSGHMIYLNVPALARYKADLAHWYDTATR